MRLCPFSSELLISNQHFQSPSPPNPISVLDKSELPFSVPDDSKLHILDDPPFSLSFLFFSVTCGAALFPMSIDHHASQTCYPSLSSLNSLFFKLSWSSVPHFGPTYDWLERIKNVCCFFSKWFSTLG